MLTCYSLFRKRKKRPAARLALFISRKKLELEPGRNLHLPHVRGSSCVLAEVSCGERVCEPRQVRMIQYVEDFPTQLEALAFGHFECLGECRIEVRQTIQTQVIASARSLLAHKGLGNTTRGHRARECAGLDLGGIAIRVGYAGSQELGIRNRLNFASGCVKHSY